MDNPIRVLKNPRTSKGRYWAISWFCVNHSYPGLISNSTIFKKVHNSLHDSLTRVECYKVETRFKSGNPGRFSGPLNRMFSKWGQGGPNCWNNQAKRSWTALLSSLLWGLYGRLRCPGLRKWLLYWCCCPWWWWLLMVERMAQFWFVRLFHGRYKMEQFVMYTSTTSAKWTFLYKLTPVFLDLDLRSNSFQVPSIHSIYFKGTVSGSESGIPW